MNHGMLPVAILAGGVAMRLRPLTKTIPKALIDVNGEPFIAHQLRLLRANGIERVIVCTGYMDEMIQSYIGDGVRIGLQVGFSFDGPRLLGTGGVIKNVLPLLGSDFIVHPVDSYLPCTSSVFQSSVARRARTA